MSSDLRQLLVDAHRGQERAARALWDSQAPRLLRYARAVVGVSGDAEDVVQNVFCRVLRMSGREVRRVEDPAAWLAQAVRREAVNQLRARRREHSRRDRAAERKRRQGVYAPMDAELEGAIEELPRRLREVVVLKHVTGLTFDQIAAATGLNRSTAASRYAAGIEALKRRLEGLNSGAASPGRAANISREVRHVG